MIDFRNGIFWFFCLWISIVFGDVLVGGVNDIFLFMMGYEEYVVCLFIVVY